VIHSLERVGEMVAEDPAFGERVKRLHAALEKLRS
jgi:hypothetical protein